MQVAHTQEAAEEILQDRAPVCGASAGGVAGGGVEDVAASVRQIVFPGMDSEYRVVSAADRNAGRGMTVQNLHCSEVSRWPGDAAETLAGLRAGLATGGGAGAGVDAQWGGRVFLSSGRGGREGDAGRRAGAAFLSLVDGGGVPEARGGGGKLTEEETEPDGAAGADVRADRVPAGNAAELRGWRGRRLWRMRRAVSGFRATVL